MSLASMVGALVLTWFIGASDSSTATVSSSRGTGDARNVLQSWAHDLQLAGSPTDAGTGSGRIAAITPTSIDFYAHLANTSCSSNASCAPLATTEIKYGLAGGNLVEQLGSQPSSVALPGNYVTAGSCLFTAYAGSTSLGCSGLTGSQLDSVTSLTIAFVITPTSGHPRSYTTTATFTTYSGTSGGTSSVQLP
jgi:hypothetical protein